MCSSALPLHSCLLLLLKLKLLTQGRDLRAELFLSRFDLLAGLSLQKITRLELLCSQMLFELLALLRQSLTLLIRELLLEGFDLLVVLAVSSLSLGSVSSVRHTYHSAS